MGAQKNRLNETVLSNTQTYVYTDGQENIYNFMFIQILIEHFASNQSICGFHHFARSGLVKLNDRLQVMEMA